LLMQEGRRVLVEVLNSELKTRGPLVEHQITTCKKRLLRF
jgi:hypothetical protein